VSRARGWATLRTAGIVVVSATFVAPLVLLALGSLRPEGLPPPRTIEAPRDPTVENYSLVMQLVPFRRMAFNSAWVALLVVPVSVVVASWAGFAAARLPRRSALALVALAAVAFSIPATSLAVSKAVLYRWIGATEGPWPLLAPALVGTTPVAVLVFAWRYRTLPPHTWDLTREIGLSPIAAWWHVAVPQTWATTGAVGAIVFVLTWGNFLDPLFFVADPRWATIPLGVRALASLPTPSQPVMLAGAVLATVPALVVAALVLRRTVRGLGADP
jgi:multiple sugar transport system permease protein